MRFAGTELSNYMSTPDFTGLGTTMMEGASLGRRAENMANGRIGIAGIQGAANVKAAGYKADAIKAGGQAQGQASMMAGLGNMVSGIAGGFMNRGSGSTYGFGDASRGQYQVPFGFGGGTYAGKGTYGPNWGIPQ